MTFFLAPHTNQAATYNPATAPSFEKINHLLTAKWNGHKMIWMKPLTPLSQAYLHSPNCTCGLPPPFPDTSLYFIGNKLNTSKHLVSLVTHISTQQGIWTAIPKQPNSSPKK